MDGQFGLASREDFWRLQNEMKNVYATQAEHSDRLNRLERRYDDDARVKSVWGSSSPFPGILNGTPQQGMLDFECLNKAALTYFLDQGYNPAAEAFKNFDQDQPHSLIGSLHLDSEEEPRRGASRANSVRFDERALHGHFSRPSTDNLPLRTGSGLGSHPMTERSSSHKSDGRQSSAGQSVHSVQSARASSFGLESRPLSATVPAFVPLGPPPGLLILGPVPSIIRCWLTMSFSNETLLYATICSASYKSIIDIGLVSKLGVDDDVVESRDGERILKLPVYLPEATIQQSSSRSNSPAPQLPTINVDFTVQDLHSDSDSLQIFLGCDTLRARSADIQFSLDRLTLFDEDRNKLSVPLVRPENSKLFQSLLTQTTRQSGQRTSQALAIEDDHVEPRTANGTTNAGAGEPTPTPSDSALANSTEDIKESIATPARHTPSVIGEGRKNSVDPINSEDRTPTTATSRDTRSSEALTNGTTPDTPTRTDSGNIWGSWRRDSTQNGKVDPSSSTTISGYQRAARGGGGRGMKVLKPARLNTSRAPSGNQGPVGFDAAPSRFGDPPRRSSQATPVDENQKPGAERRSFSGEAKSQPQSATSSKPRPSNPVGGASAFGWLNTGDSKSASTSAE